MIPPTDDLDRIMAVMAASFDPLYREAWTRRQVEDALVLGNCQYILVDEGGNTPADGAPAAGFSLLRTSLDEEELLLFAVDPAYRRRGLGLAMLRSMAQRAAARGIVRVVLEMRRGNPAESLYRKFGFQVVGERPEYYRTTTGDRLDAITFAREIP